MCISKLLFPQPIEGKGLAMATFRPQDLDALGVSWWYVWHWLETADPWYIPMVRNWSIPTDKLEPAYLLLGNEPNYWEPWGCTMSPEGAAWYTIKAQEYYPNARLVVGNVSQHDHFGGLDGVTWLEQFLAEYKDWAGKPFDHILGCHLYTDDDLDYADYEMQRYRAVYAGPMWLTELGMAVNPAQPKTFRKLCQMASKLFDRVAVYTNEQDGSASSLPFDMDLAPGGVLSEIGKEYAKL